jgi:L-lactate dehydrogenase complex protein LldE
MSSAKIGLFASCSVDLFRPSVGFATAALLEYAGYVVEVPPQSCCGQAHFNNAGNKAAKALAWQVVETFEHYDYIVIPSGSCGGMIKYHYPELFQNDPRLGRVQAFCDKVYELVSFLTAFNCALPPASENLNKQKVTYHDSCAGLREMGIYDQPRALLQQQGAVDIIETPDSNVCCGFGGTFCVKYGSVSEQMAHRKVASMVACGAETVLGGDVSCLLNLAGQASREGHALKFRHVAEVLANELAYPAIGSQE